MFDFLKFGANGETPQNFTAEDESPGSAEVFSLEHLKARAEELAQTHRVAARGKRVFDLLARLKDNKNELDGKMLPSNRIELADDGLKHNVRVILGEAAVKKAAKQIRQANKV